MQLIFKKGKLLKNNKGSSIIIFAAMLTLLAAFAALVIDIGAAVTEKAKLSAAVDSAALAGVQELIANRDNTRNVIDNYLVKNAGVLKDVTVNIADDERSVEVSGSKTAENYFAKVFGMNIPDLSASAKAKAENIRSLKGARPLAVVQQTFSYGRVYTLKEGGGDGSTGNYAAISLGGTGGSVYRDNLLNGYSGTVSVGDMIQTETGNIAGTTQTSINYLINSCTHTPSCTYEYYNPNCPRILFIPVVDTLEVNGRKYVKVLGFATFFLEGVTDHAGQADVIGRFITYNMQGETSSEVNDYGTYGIRLIK